MPVDAEQSRPASRSASASVAARTGGLAAAAVVVLLVIAMLAAALAGRPAFDTPRVAPAALPQPTPQETMAPAGAGDVSDTDDGTLLAVIAAVFALLVAAAVITALVLLVRALLASWASRPLRRARGADIDVEVRAETVDEPAPDAHTVRRGIALARATIDAHPDPGDAIVAAWVGLEETAADSGVGRGRSETPAEFVVRILRHRPEVDEATGRLLRLYEGVRFGGRAADETARADAARCLAEIERGWR